jgi:SpoVK/Ycf46/Vps4 family AAA+-type ATPase
MGPPGTGKSSLVAAGVEALDLLPIYAKRADAILDKNFVSFVFGASDTYMAKIAGTAAKARSDLFVETLTKEREFKAGQPLLQKNVDEEAPRVPIIVVEDADMLLAPRSSGNMIMPQLLNETDGIGSNHTRKIVFTTNLSHTRDIDEALMRAGRCYEVVNCRLLTPKEAVAARWANGLPEFEVMPTNDISLAEALRKPRKKISISNGKAGLGFN